VLGPVRFYSEDAVPRPCVISPRKLYGNDGRRQLLAVSRLTTGCVTFLDCGSTFPRIYPCGRGPVVSRVVRC